MTFDISKTHWDVCILFSLFVNFTHWNYWCWVKKVYDALRISCLYSHTNHSNRSLYIQTCDLYIHIFALFQIFTKIRFRLINECFQLKPFFMLDISRIHLRMHRFHWSSLPLCSYLLWRFDMESKRLQKSSTYAEAYVKGWTPFKYGFIFGCDQNAANTFFTCQLQHDGSLILLVMKCDKIKFYFYQN